MGKKIPITHYLLSIYYQSKIENRYAAMAILVEYVGFI